MAKPNGRPERWTQKLADEICGLISNGQSLRSVCRMDDMPAASTVRIWVNTDKNGFSKQYDNALTERAHRWADEIMDIADDGANDFMETEHGVKQNTEALQRSRLRVDTRKWLLSKMLPRYADKPAENSDVVTLAQSVSKLIDKLPN